MNDRIQQDETQYHSILHHCIQTQTAITFQNYSVAVKEYIITYSLQFLADNSMQVFSAHLNHHICFLTFQQTIKQRQNKKIINQVFKP